MSSHTIALISIVGASFFWASAGVVAKILLRSFTPFPLAFLRFLIASLVILPLFLKYKPPHLRRLLKDTLPIALLSTANITLFYFGLTRTTNNAAAIIYSSVPLMTALLAKRTLGEHVTPKKIASILLGFVGVLTILILPLMEKGQRLSGDFWGNALIVVASVTWALYTIGSRYLVNQRHYSPLTVTTVSLVTSTVVFAIFTHIFFPMNYLSPLFEGHNFILMIHLGVVVTVATYLLFQWALKHASATTVSLNNYLQPVFSIALGILILGERITVGFVVGSLLVFGGVFLATGTQVFKQVSLLRRYLK